MKLRMFGPSSESMQKGQQELFAMPETPAEEPKPAVETVTVTVPAVVVAEYVRTKASAPIVPSGESNTVDSKAPISTMPKLVRAKPLPR